MQLLANVSFEQAALKPIKDAHSIWEIVNHINTWHLAGSKRINGDPAKISDAEDWPAVNDFSEKSWNKAVDDMRNSFRALRYEIQNFPESRLEEKVLDMSHTYYLLFHGIIQHDLYHSGQIAIIKKALTNPT